MYTGPWELALNGPIYIKTKLSFGLHHLQGPRGERYGMCKGAQRLRKSPCDEIPVGHKTELSASAFIICKDPAASAMGCAKERSDCANPPATKSRWGIKTALSASAFIICKGPAASAMGCAKERSDCANPSERPNSGESKSSTEYSISRTRSTLTPRSLLQ